jgi:uncharacterized protein
MLINRTLVSWSRTIHIYLSIALFVILVFFSITGITLNHVDVFIAEPEITEIIVDSLPELPLDSEGLIADSPELGSFLLKEFGVNRAKASITHDAKLLLVDYRSPGATAFIEIDQDEQKAVGEKSDYGFIAMLNDLHKARETDVIWKWLLDISSILLIFFSIVGFVLLLPNNYRLKRVAAYTAIVAILISFGYWLGAP